MLRPKLVKPRGILHHGVEPAVPGYGRYWPADDLAPFVEHFWTVAWEVAEPEVHGATLALDLGYADQAHFIRDFKKLVGSSPAEYARAYRGRSGASMPGE